MTLEFVGLEICVPDLIWTIINFFVLFFLLKRFLFRPILQFMDKRNAVIEEGRKQGIRALQEIQAAEEESRDALKTCNADSVRQISMARGQSEEDRKKILDQAARDSLTVRKDIKNRIRQEELEARESSQTHLHEYVKILSEKLLS